MKNKLRSKLWNKLMVIAAVGTANIQNLAVGDAQIASMKAGKLLADTISAAVTLTSPTLVVSGSTFTINLDTTNGLKISGSGVTTTLANIYDPAGYAGMKCVNNANSLASLVMPQGFLLRAPSGNLMSQFVAVQDGGGKWGTWLYVEPDGAPSASEPCQIVISSTQGISSSNFNYGSGLGLTGAYVIGGRTVTFINGICTSVV